MRKKLTDPQRFCYLTDLGRNTRRNWLM